MPSEAQLKAQIKAAIAKKKQTDAPPSDSTIPTDAPNPSPTKTTSKVSISDTSAKKDPPPVIVPPPVKRRKEVIKGALSEVEWTRTFFGRQIKIAVYQKQVYYAVQDILEIACSTDENIKYQQLMDNPDTKKIIAPLAIYIMFPSPNGGSIALESATAEDLITILDKLEFQQSINIEKWLTDTSNSLMVIVG